jgi:deoxyribose-phosphate aldolase
LSSPKLGGNVSFPSGGETIYIKVQEALELIKMGVDEIDKVSEKWILSRQILINRQLSGKGYGKTLVMLTISMR